MDPALSPSDDRTPSTSTSPPNFIPVQEVPDVLITFMLQHDDEPPQKRKRLAVNQTLLNTTSTAVLDVEHIVVNCSVLEVQFTGCKLASYETLLERNNVPFVHSPGYIEIIDDTKRPIIRVPISSEDGLDDVRLALLVHLESKKWAKTHGRLWTIASLALFQRDQTDVLQIKFIVKWNVTPLPEQITRANKTQALIKVLRKYFPDPNMSSDKPVWSPQDFYESVHSFEKNDHIAASMTVQGLGAELYPFQKRAVQFMLRREGVEWTDFGITHTTQTDEMKLPISFIEARDANGRFCYVSHVFGIVVLDTSPFLPIEQLRGGILAEEMGLGKTMETVALISLHKRPKDNQKQFSDTYTGKVVRPSGATLIICPPSILQQWIAEVAKHAPYLKVLHYKGIKAYKGYKGKSLSDLVEKMCLSDVVFVSSHHVSAEVYFTDLNPEKTLRQKSKYPRPMSPLMMLSWWRCLIDEAQMFESGGSNAAVVARLIPRINAWCVTGTPVRKGVNDLLGLLVFLRLEPYASTKHIWSSLTRHKPYFQSLLSCLSLRHSKSSVRDELKLPTQKRFIITVPFTPIEEQHYQELFKQMCDECGLDAQGASLSAGWDLDSVSDSLRKYLVRLRQTALHPEVGGKNRRALGNKDSKVSTIDKVLETMMDQTDQAIRVDQRALLILRLRRGQLFENSPRVKEALAIWSETAKEASLITEECRQQLRSEIAKSLTNEESCHTIEHGDVNDSEDDQEDADLSSRLGVFRNRLRGALEVEHMAKFFQANAYFQIKSDESITKTDTPEFRELESHETKCYEAAKILRKEILQQVHRKANKLMGKVSKKTIHEAFVRMPRFLSNSLPQDPFPVRRFRQQLDELASTLDAQANVLDEWRAKTLQILLLPLVDEDDGLEVTGDEYEESTKSQDEIIVYMQALRAIVADRHDIFTGQKNKLVEYEMVAAERLAKAGLGAFPEKTLELFQIRHRLKPKSGSIKGLIAEIRAALAPLRLEASSGSLRASDGLTMLETQLAFIQDQYSLQMKAVSICEKEVNILTNIMNARLEYYRQLQQVSDMVAPYEGPKDERILARMEQEELTIVKSIATKKSKHRYLEFLATNAKENRVCAICRDIIEVGALTTCGHSYCKECISMWWKSHKTCPTCTRKLARGDLFTYKPQTLSIQADISHENSQSQLLPATKLQNTIYKELSKSMLAEINNIELNGPSFSTKVDTIARHLIWLRNNHSGKSIVYSQFRDFLDILAQAFEMYRIGFASFDKPNGIENFRQDPGIECFLLHAKAHSSGLNLVNASHVFLCEPLLNTALELQAIARVDRIGQAQETNVWLYLIEGSVEESIHQLSVRRRMEHIDKRTVQGKGKGRVSTDEEFLSENLEEANSTELQQASLTALLAKGGKSGEVVKNEDLWECLFGGNQKTNGQSYGHDLGLELSIGRHLANEAMDIET